MGIYVYNNPLVVSKEGGWHNITLSIDGDANKGGKRVVQWSNVGCSVSWATFVYEDSDSDGNGYYYDFSFTANATNNVNQRYAICYGNYTLEDGTTGSISFYVYQEGDGGISIDSVNPLIFSSDITKRNPISPEVFYKNGTADIINTPTVYGNFKATATYGYTDSGGYSIEYDVEALRYNVTSKAITGTVTFSYNNPNSSVVNNYVLHIIQDACANPFGIQPNDYEIVEEKDFANVTRRIRNIPFKANSFYFTCNFPYMNGNSVRVWLDDESFATLQLQGGGQIDEKGSRESYVININENYNTGVRSFKLNVEYETLDEVKHTDYVQLIQNASDGSNLSTEVTSNVEFHKFKYDGTPELYGYSRIRYIGSLIPQTPIVDVDWLEIGSPKLVESIGEYNKLYEYPITVHKNETSEVRTTYVRYYGTVVGDSTKAYGVDIEYIQARLPEKEPIILPDIPVEGGDYIGQIWKDVEYDFGNVDIVKYGIYTTYLTTIGDKVTEVDTLVFKGMSCKRPDDSNKIYINKICQNYLDLPLLNLDSVAVGGGYGVFKLKSEDGKTTYKTYRFVNDWSYTNDFKTGLLSHPILNDNSNVVRGQLLPFTVFGAAEKVEIPYGIKYYDDITDDYGNNIDDWDNVVILRNGIETEIFPYSGRTDGAKAYYIGDKTYNVVDDCSVEYVVYYVNPWGGYDWFPIRGKVTEKDTFTQYSIRQNYNNNTLEFGKKRYCNEITKKITLNTQWLREDESLRMWYLLQSNVVYLHNINKNEIYPVVITATETEYKKRTKQSSRISYQIECEFSQSRTRF